MDSGLSWKIKAFQIRRDVGLPVVKTLLFNIVILTNSWATSSCAEQNIIEFVTLEKQKTGEKIARIATFPSLSRNTPVNIRHQFTTRGRRGWDKAVTSHWANVIGNIRNPCSAPAPAAGLELAGVRRAWVCSLLCWPYRTASEYAKIDCQSKFSWLFAILGDKSILFFF